MSPARPARSQVSATAPNVSQQPSQLPTPTANCQTGTYALAFPTWPCDPGSPIPPHVGLSSFRLKGRGALGFIALCVLTSRETKHHLGPNIRSLLSPLPAAPCGCRWTVACDNGPAAPRGPWRLPSGSALAAGCYRGNLRSWSVRGEEGAVTLPGRRASVPYFPSPNARPRRQGPLS